MFVNTFLYYLYLYLIYPKNTLAALPQRISVAVLRFLLEGCVVWAIYFLEHPLQEIIKSNHRDSQSVFSPAPCYSLWSNYDYKKLQTTEDHRAFSGSMFILCGSLCPLWLNYYYNRKLQTDCFPNCFYLHDNNPFESSASPFRSGLDVRVFNHLEDILLSEFFSGLSHC